MANMTTPIKFMHQLMQKLQYTYDGNQNKLNSALADLTDIDGLNQITNWSQLKDMIKSDITANLNNGGDGKKFLKDYCNIDLDNEDCGALIGFDCSGGDVLNNDNIIEETGDLQSHPSSAVIGGCTINFPTFLDSKYNYVMDGLYTWWIGLPFELVKKSFGLEFNEDSFVTSMDVDLYDDPPDGGIITGAYVESSYSLIDYKTNSLVLKVNMNDAAFGQIIIGDKSGNNTGGNFPALDIVLAHELTHAVMSANIRGFNAWLPHWFVEGGSAELVNGCDDSRTPDLLDAAINTSIIEDGMSDNPTMAREYSVGFIAMRYLLKKYTDKTIKIVFPVKPKASFEKVWEKMAHGIRSEHCISRDGDLNKIMDEFVDFVQRDDYDLVQPWTLCSNTGSKTLRIPLEGHEEKEEDSVCSMGYVPLNIEGNTNSYVAISTALRLQGGGNIPYYLTPAFANKYYDINNYLNDVDLNLSDSYIVKTEYEISSYFNTHKSDYSVIVLQGNAVTAFSNDLYYSIANTHNLVVVQLDKIPMTSVNLNTISDEDFLKYFDSSLDSNDELSVQGLINTIGVYYDLRSRLIDSLIAVKPSTISLGNFYKNLIMSSYGVFESKENTNLFSSTLDCALNFYGALEHAIIGAHFNPHPWIKQATVPSTTKFYLSKKESTDFPCFYLSTGVFTPSTWNGQGLSYPAKVIDNYNDEYIPFNIHVLNDVNMRFDLQGIGACKRVTGKQGDADILNGVRQIPGSPHWVADVESDVLPGIGSPLIVCSQENKEKYNTILCYFTKTSYSGTFTLIFYDDKDESINPIFQSVAFGLGITEEESYKYPLYTAGGTSGLMPAWYSFTYTVPGRPSYDVTLDIYGNQFNCDMKRGEALESLLYPLTTERCGISNFRILQASGEWKSAINYKQYFYKRTKETCGTYVYKNDSDETEDFLVYPTISNTKLVDRFTLVQPVSVIKKHITDENESGFFITINGVKCKPDRLRAMFTALDEHEYLIVPCGWYGRDVGIPIRPLSGDESLVDVIKELMETMPKQEYVLCIDLG